MVFPGEQTYHKLARLLVAPTLEPSQRAARIQTVEKDVILPLRVLLIAVLGYFFFLSHWSDVPNQPRGLGHALFQQYFWFYLVVNIAAGAIYIWVHQLSLKNTQWINVSVGILDVYLMTGLTFIMDGFDSPLYPVFAVLILHNALAIPLALPQILLNLLVILGYITGGFLDQTMISGEQWSMTQVAKFFFGKVLHQNLLMGDSSKMVAIKAHGKILHHILPAGLPTPELRSENPYERILVLVIWAACCYGIQVLFEKQKRAEAEATEFAVRQERLRTAGRLAAEIAHKIKNPLGIITNAAFCLQRAVNDGEFAVEEQIKIIREEVSRADQILTVLMGYAQLAEGRVERLEVAAEIDDAILQVFPPAAKYDVRLKRYYSSELPAILMQKQHLSSILVNLLQNAREALDGHGEIEITTRYGGQDSIIITIADNGPGIAPDKIDKIFEAYFTTRAKGTGLGLAIVKHNTEMYGGAVHVQSELGKGTRFTLEFPPRILMRLNP
ncbi:MAG: ATP-binding protein [Verrucomicrobiota bacterium]|jgi:signal transduction histidine kinase